MNIRQIAIDNAETPCGLGFIFGLGDDNKVYVWSLATTEWKLAHIPPTKYDNVIPF
jgi:hypothetical protein